MSRLVVLLALPVGFLAGRWWAVAAGPLLLVASITAFSVAENVADPCTRPDGCGAGPVLGAFVLACLLAAVVAALLAAGVALRRRSGRWLSARR